MKFPVVIAVSLLFELNVLATPTSPTEPDPANFVNVTLNGQTFIDKVGI